MNFYTENVSSFYAYFTDKFGGALIRNLDTNREVYLQGEDATQFRDIYETLLEKNYEDESKFQEFFDVHCSGYDEVMTEVAA